MYTSHQLTFQSIKLAFSYVPKRPFNDCFTNLPNFSSQKDTSSVKGDDDVMTMMMIKKKKIMMMMMTLRMICIFILNTYK